MGICSEYALTIRNKGKPHAPNKQIYRSETAAMRSMNTKVAYLERYGLPSSFYFENTARIDGCGEGVASGALLGC